VDGSDSDAVNTVPTRPETTTEHGDHRTRWLAVLGLVLAAFALTLPLTAPATVRAWQSQQPDPTRSVTAQPEVSPYVVAPAVSLAAAKASPARPDPAAGRPTRLIVPQLDVDAAVVPIPVNDGILLPPSDPQTLGWWFQGAAPGALRGSALITGHTVHTGGGAFDNLETLHRGDRVLVRTVKGTIEYAVSGVTIYHKGRLAHDAQRVFSQTAPGRLVLITCEDWNGSGYDSNAIVFAERLD
jgi:LPXTG-site transpeptidase (sortase) family protein